MSHEFDRRAVLKAGAGGLLELARQSKWAKAGKLLVPTAAGAAAISGRLPENPGKAEAAETPVIPNKKVDFEVIFPREVRGDWSYSTYDPYPYLDFGPLGPRAEAAYPRFRAYYVEDGPAHRFDTGMANIGIETNLRGLLHSFVATAYRLAGEYNLPANVIDSLGFCFSNGIAGLFFGDTLPENTIGGVRLSQYDLRALLALACAHAYERGATVDAFHIGEPVMAEVTPNFYFPVGAVSLDNSKVKVGYSGISALDPRNPIRNTSSLRSTNSPQLPDHVKSNIKPEENPNGGWTVESQMPLWLALAMAKIPNPNIRPLITRVSEHQGPVTLELLERLAA